MMKREGGKAKEEINGWKMERERGKGGGGGGRRPISYFLVFYIKRSE